jgi:hypothetical protein
MKKKHYFNAFLILAFGYSIYVNNFFAGIICGTSFTVFVLLNIGRFVLFTAMKSINKKIADTIINQSKSE